MNILTVVTILTLSISVTLSRQKSKNKPSLKPLFQIKPKSNQPSSKDPLKQDNLITKS